MHVQNIQLADIGAAALVFHQNKILLVQIGYGRNKGHWILPGGMVEVGEAPHQAAKRETLEETGLEIEITRLFSVRHRMPKEGRNNTYWVFESRLKTPTDQISRQLHWPSEEILEARFWSFEDVQRDTTVRPLTQLFVRLATERKAERSQKDENSEPFILPSPGSMDTDFVYL